MGQIVCNYITARLERLRESVQLAEASMLLMSEPVLSKMIKDG